MVRAIPDLTTGADLPRAFPRPWPVRGDGGRSVRYSLVAATCRASLRTLLGRGLRVEGLENVPRAGGPLLIACNHLSNLDPPLLGGYTPGANCAMGKKELFSRPYLAWLLGGCNCYPVDRGTADRWALKTALAMLDHGGHLMLWVEGTRAGRPGMKQAEPGVGFLLRRRPVPVLPVAISGTEAALVRGSRRPRRVPVTVRFGVPGPIDTSGGNQAVADRVGARIASLLPEEYRGFYAGAAADLERAAGGLPR